MPPSPRPSTTRRDGWSSPTVSVVIPALDAADSLPAVLRALPPVDEVIVVDGGSGDGTAAAARAARPDVYVLRQTRRGRGNALLCGFAARTGDIVVSLNADGSTDPGEIPRYVDALVAGADVAHGSRYGYGDGGAGPAGGRLDRIGAAVLSRLVNRLGRPALRGTGGVVPAPRRDEASAVPSPRPCPAVAPLLPAPAREPDTVSRVPREPAAGRHAAPVGAGTVPSRRSTPAHLMEVPPMGAHPTGRAVGVVPPTGRGPERTPVDRRRGYPGPRPPWAPSEPGTHRTVDVDDTGVGRGRVYDSGAHRLPDEDTGGLPARVRRSGLYDTGVGRLGVYDSGVHRTDVYDTGAPPPDESGPLDRRPVPREVGGGRRRLDARDRHPDLTVIPGEG